MQKRIIARIIIIVTFILTVGTTVVFAKTSTATINYGSSSRVAGVTQSLGSSELNGKVTSYASSGGNTQQRLIGYIITKGNIWIHTRDSAQVSPGCVASLYWSNPDKETGTFWAEAEAPSANHNGYCSVWQ